MNRNRSSSRGEKLSPHHSCFHFVNPSCFSRIPNNVIIELLLSLPHPWPDGAVRLYLYTSAGFGRRFLPLRDAQNHFCRIELQKGEFICAAESLASLSGRSRNTITRIIAETSVKVRKTAGNRNVYRVIKYQPEQPPPENRSSRNSVNMAKESGCQQLPERAAVPPVSEQHIKITERERENSSFTIIKNHHAAHDAKEKRSGQARPLKHLLPRNDHKPLREPEHKHCVSKATALQTLCKLRDKIPGDQLHDLLRRYKISPEELDAAALQSALNLEPSAPAT